MGGGGPLFHKLTLLPLAYSHREAERRLNMHETNPPEPQKPQLFFRGGGFMWTFIIALIVLVLAVIFQMR